MLRHTSKLIVVLAFLLAACAIFSAVFASSNPLTWFASDQRIKGKVATTAVVWTDKPSYSLGESAAIFGSGFLSRSTINVEVVRPDLIVNRWNTSSDVDGNFTTTYLLDGMV
jgi:phosphatidate phosphatase APP1